MSEAQTSMEHVPDPHMADHPSPRKYVNVAIILAIITAIEVAIYYVDRPRGPPRSDPPDTSRSSSS